MFDKNIIPRKTLAYLIQRAADKAEITGEAREKLDAVAEKATVVLCGDFQCGTDACPLTLAGLYDPDNEGDSAYVGITDKQGGDFYNHFDALMVNNWYANRVEVVDTN